MIWKIFTKVSKSIEKNKLLRRIKKIRKNFSHFLRHAKTVKYVLSCVSFKHFISN